MKGGLLFQASYVGRLARHLLATRDVMALNNLKDPKSGMDWYTAATMLEKQRQLGTDPANIQPIPYFENILPAGYAATAVSNGYSLPTNASNTQAVYAQAFEYWANDWTDIQDEIENYAGQTLGQANPVPYFFNPQYGALSAWGTIANSNYHGFSASLRQRFHDLQWDFNYTYSHSLDNASGLQTSTTYGGAFILNGIRPNDNYCQLRLRSPAHHQRECHLSAAVRPGEAFRKQYEPRPRRRGRRLATFRHIPVEYRAAKWPTL